MSSTHAAPTTHLSDPARAVTGGGAPSRKSRFLRALVRAGGGAGVSLAGRRFFPLWAIVRHAGRRSGRAYDTPVVVECTGDGFLIPLPFGGSTQWARNVLAAGGSTIRWRAHEYRVGAPEVIDWQQARSSYGPVLRLVIPVVGIRTFLKVTVEPGSSIEPGSSS